MAKKKTDKVARKDDNGRAILVRPDDPRLVDRLDAYAKSIRNSRNMAIVLLLEKALAEVGY